jgi:hypothetical protein
MLDCLRLNNLRSAADKLYQKGTCVQRRIWNHCAEARSSAEAQQTSPAANTEAHEVSSVSSTSMPPSLQWNSAQCCRRNCAQMGVETQGACHGPLLVSLTLLKYFPAGQRSSGRSKVFQQAKRLPTSQIAWETCSSRYRVLSMISDQPQSFRPMAHIKPKEHLPALF